MEILSGLIGGIVAGIIVYIFQYNFEKRREKFITSKIYKKTIESDIFEKLKPNITLERTKELLGVPDKTFNGENPNEFDIQDAREREFWLYEFNNCIIKISSEDYASVESITIMSLFKEKQIKLNILLDQNIILGKSILDKSLILNTSKLCIARTIRDLSFGLGNWYGHPLNFFITFYGIPNFESMDKLPKDVSDLENMVINTISISKNRNVSFYIYIYEIY